jgi:hypothetical protein
MQWSGDAVVGQCNGQEMQMVGRCSGRAMGKCNGREMQWSGNQSESVVVQKVNRLGKRNLGKGRSERGRGKPHGARIRLAKKGNIGDRQVWWFLPQQENGLGDFGD